eukprot:1968095-Ditylum_brightwellii.AAC.1
MAVAATAVSLSATTKPSLLSLPSKARHQSPDWWKNRLSGSDGISLQGHERDHHQISLSSIKSQ